MSGGSYDYLYGRIDDMYVGRTYDAELDDMLEDLCGVLHDLEWWRSSDYSEEDYRESLAKFKAKWFNADGREKRLKEYIDTELSESRKRMYALVGIKTDE